MVEICEIKGIEGIKPLNVGIGGDRGEIVLWRTKNLSGPPSLKNVVVLSGTNNLFTDSPLDLADCVVKIGSCGLILRDESWSINRVLINGVNRIFKYLCLKHDFPYIDQSDG